MIRKMTRSASWALLALVVAVSGGCLAAAAGAGAAGGIYLTNQGASGVVDGSVNTVAGRIPGVLSEMGIQVTGHGTEDNGNEHNWAGTRGDLEVKVELKRESDTTSRVNVSARENAVEWDKDFARSVVQRIVQAR